MQCILQIEQVDISRPNDFPEIPKTNGVSYWMIHSIHIISKIHCNSPTGMEHAFILLNRLLVKIQIERRFEGYF